MDSTAIQCVSKLLFSLCNLVHARMHSVYKSLKISGIERKVYLNNGALHNAIKFIVWLSVIIIIRHGFSPEPPARGVATPPEVLPPPPPRGV